MNGWTHHNFKFVFDQNTKRQFSANDTLTMPPLFAGLVRTERAPAALLVAFNTAHGEHYKAEAVLVSLEQIDNMSFGRAEVGNHPSERFVALSPALQKAYQALRTIPQHDEWTYDFLTTVHDNPLLRLGDNWLLGLNRRDSNGGPCTLISERFVVVGDNPYHRDGYNRVLGEEIERSPDAEFVRRNGVRQRRVPGLIS